MTEQEADHLAAIPLGHVTRQWPHALSHILAGPEDLALPATLHPVFHGSLDWHSCVHGYWTLATLLHRFPAMPSAPAIRALFDARLTPKAIACECAYLQRTEARGFERPYGWAWVLALQHALRGTPWAPATAPLARIMADRFRAFLPASRYPVRVGTHTNTAFALILAATDPALRPLLRRKAIEWYATDTACQAWEPSQDDFLSSALTEAACMLRLLPPADFRPWFAAFLPHLAERRPATLFEPASVTDRTDGKIAHLDGLNLSRAWCWSLLRNALPPDDPRSAPIDKAIEDHQAASLPNLATHYMGEHWLATFALLAKAPFSLSARARAGVKG